MPLLTLGVLPTPVPLIRHADVPHPERAVERGTLVKVRHGVYTPGAMWRDLAPWDRYLARVHAVALVHPDAVFSHESAAVLMGLPVFGDPGVVHILEHPRSASRLVGGIRTHAYSGDRTIIELGGLLMTSIADTAVDLARHRHRAVGLAVADAALRTDPTASVELLVALNEARTSKRGRAIARWALSRASALAESALESMSRAVVEWLGFPAPVLQVPFRRGSGGEDRSDLVWESIGLAGECDGDLKYDGRYGPPTVVLVRQSERDTRLRRHLREVTHWGWREASTVTPLRGILTGAGLRPESPEDSAALFSPRRAVSPHPPHRTGEPPSAR
ncbi:hypothetical protein [Microbacterium sp. zg-YB36]|uniref:type IV toxin-antitoxin system AbiEi family antitoxin domain-containing protein n=1 Tax=Microbacterium sp. zg-YB36 TaxID=2969407 RepID=UPI00214B3C29|nr:hypothetical protein [Microbacterium sp. zg-YB36]MDL5350656.1 hypothetical protein [Microbacterium sp. zg-YB36]